MNTIVAKRFRDGPRPAPQMMSGSSDTTGLSRADHAAQAGSARARRNAMLNAALHSTVLPKHEERRRDRDAYNTARIARMLAEQAALLASRA